MRLARERYRFELKQWYGILLSGWLVLTLPAACIFAQANAAGAVGGGNAALMSMARMPLDSFSLLLGDPAEIGLFFWLWLPVLSAPFGLFTKISAE